MSVFAVKWHHIKLDSILMEISVYKLAFYQRRCTTALALNHEWGGGGGGGSGTGRILNTVPPAVDHRHDVRQIQTLHHHLHEVVVSASAGHELIQGEFTCWRKGRETWYVNDRNKKCCFLLTHLKTVNSQIIQTIINVIITHEEKKLLNWNKFSH